MFFNISNSLGIFSIAILDLERNFLPITSRVFPSTHFRPVQDEYHVSWVCMAGPNYLRVTTFRPCHTIDSITDTLQKCINCVSMCQCIIWYITMITYMTLRQCRIMCPYYTTPSSVCHSDSLFNVS